jgi:hypothetical protein
MKKRQHPLLQSNKAAATKRWGKLPDQAFRALDILSEMYGFSVGLGDIAYLDGHWYVTHIGLIRLASRNSCIGIDVQPAPEFCQPAASRWAFRATVYKSRSCRGFVGYGDADPSNVSALVRGAEMRVAETRAVNRALRKAYGIGICSIEEIGTHPTGSEPKANVRKVPPQSTDGNCGPKLRDQLFC